MRRAHPESLSDQDAIVKRRVDTVGSPNRLQLDSRHPAGDSHRKQYAPHPGRETSSTRVHALSTVSGRIMFGLAPELPAARTARPSSSANNALPWLRSAMRRSSTRDGNTPSLAASSRRSASASRGPDVQTFWCHRELHR
jgi:hypothetical protein